MTTPARTIADLRRTEDDELVSQAVRAANYKRMEIGNEDGDGGARSELERSFLRLCSSRKIPRPEVNLPVGPYTVDFVWPFDRVAVETDGWSAHRGRQRSRTTMAAISSCARRATRCFGLPGGRSPRSPIAWWGSFAATSLPTSLLHR